MNPIEQQHYEVVTGTDSVNEDNWQEKDARSHADISKKAAINYLRFYRQSNWLHEFTDEEKLWEDFIKDEGREKGCPFDEPIYNPEKKDVCQEK